MIHLSPNEKILLVLHRHWMAIFWRMLIGVVLIILPNLAAPYFPAIESGLGMPQVAFWFFISIYLMIVVLITFLFWIAYYLDIWIVTSERIIDVRQLGLFNRNTSEFLISKVEDVTVEVPNMLATLFKYGNIVVHTGEGAVTFRMEQIPHVYEAKNLILDYSMGKQNVGPQQMGAN